MKRLSVALAAISLPLFFQNCGNNFAKNLNSSSGGSGLCKVQKKTASPFAQGKLQMSWPNNQGQLQKAGSAEIELGVLIETQCLDEHPEYHQLLGQPLSRPVGHTLRQQVISVTLSTSIEEAELKNALDSNPCIIGVSENSIVKNSASQVDDAYDDPYSIQQSHLELIGHSSSLDLQGQITAPVIIAVIDTGVQKSHPDLLNRLWQGTSGEYGYNFVSPGSEPIDDDGHGTHVSGIMTASRKNQFGSVGLLEPFAEIMSIKALDSTGAGTTQNIYNAIQYAIEADADIINLSIESPGSSPLIEAGLKSAVENGVVVVVATGNQADEIKATNLYSPAYVAPDVEGVLSVASLDSETLKLSYFSNYSTHYAEFVAPGAEDSQTGILSTHLNSSFRRISGTSQATPMVTSAAAILIGSLKTNGRSYTPAGIESFLTENGTGYVSALSPYVKNGGMIHLGQLSENITTFLNSQTDLPDEADPISDGCSVE